MTTIEDKVFLDARDVINSAFPDLSWLRCGGTKFGLKVQNIAGATGLYPRSDRSNRYDLTCETCGKIEYYDSDFLDKVPKPTSLRVKHDR